MMRKNIIKKAEIFAKLKHKNQKDDSEKNYVDVHCRVVSRILSLVCPTDTNLIAAGFLHDTIEDTSTLYDELIIEFNKDIADLIMEVTHERNKENTQYYFPRLKTVRGILLKFADRLSNLSRMYMWDKKRQEKYLEKSKFWRSTA